MSIPRFSRLLNTLEQLLLRLDGYLIVQFKVKGVQVLNTTPNLFLINNYSRIHHFNDTRGYNHMNAIRDELETCVDPLDVSQGHNLINIVTGKITNKNVNVGNAVQIGEIQLQEFESACPTGFYQTIKRKVITMKEGKKQRGAGPMEQCDSGFIFARVTSLMSTRAIRESPAAMEVRSDALVQRFDLKTTHEEADVIIPQQVVALADMV